MKTERYFSLQNDRNIGFAHLVSVLAICLLLWPQSIEGQQAPVPKMTQSQVEELVDHKVPDATLQVQIQKRGLTPAPTQAFIDSLRAKGAGPLTLAAVKAALHSSSQTATNTKSPSQAQSIPAPAGTKPHAPAKVTIDPAVAEGLLLHKTNPDPRYLKIAKATRSFGTVELKVTVSEAGRVETSEAISGSPFLQSAAIDTVKNWIYRPFTLNKTPVKFETTVSVTFTQDADNSAPATTPDTQPVMSRPRDTGPSLAATISFIKNKSIQPMSYQLTIDTPAGVQNVINDRGYVGDFDFNSSACSLHSTSVSDVTAEIRKKGKTYSRYNQHEETSVSYSFKDIDSVQVLRGDDYYKQRSTKLGHPEYSISTDSPFFVVKLSSSKLAFSVKETSKKDNEAAVARDKTADETTFGFRDEETANSVAKAVNRAINLCRAGSSQLDAESRTPQSSDAGIWVDPATHLVWTAKDNGSDVNWQQATDYCHVLHLPRYSGWRLPTIDELQGIYDHNANANGRYVKGGLQLSGFGVWSRSQGIYSGLEWDFSFLDGRRFSEQIGASKMIRALCVRGTEGEAADQAAVVPVAMDQSAVTTTDPIVVGTFYLVDTTGLLHHLESTSLTVVGANSSAPVFSVAGARSTARYPQDPTYRYLVHLPSGTIPTLYQYIEDQGTRTLTFKKVLGFASLKKGKLLSLDTLGVKDGATFVKPQHPLAAGEYCLSVTDQGTNLSCFGIDAQ